jgi:hypothetical protein
VIAAGDSTRQEDFDLDLRNLAPATPFMITSFLPFDFPLRSVSALIGSLTQFSTFLLIVKCR